MFPGNLVRGSHWLCTQNPYANFRLWLTRHTNVNKRVSSPDLLIFRQFHRHILKKSDNAVPNNFHFYAREKIGVGLEKQAAIFHFSFTRRWEVWYSCFDFFSSAIWRCFQLSGLWNTHLTYQIRCIATYIYVEIHKMLNFPSICSGDWNICAEYDLRGRLPLTGALTLMWTRKPTVRCLITRPDYHLWEH